DPRAPPGGPTPRSPARASGPRPCRSHTLPYAPRTLRVRKATAPRGRTAPSARRTVRGLALPHECLRRPLRKRWLHATVLFSPVLPIIRIGGGVHEIAHGETPTFSRSAVIAR